MPHPTSLARSLCLALTLFTSAACATAGAGTPDIPTSPQAPEVIVDPAVRDHILRDDPDIILRIQPDLWSDTEYKLTQLIAATGPMPDWLIGPGWSLLYSNFEEFGRAISLVYSLEEFVPAGRSLWLKTWVAGATPARRALAAGIPIFSSAELHTATTYRILLPVSPTTHADQVDAKLSAEDYVDAVRVRAHHDYLVIDVKLSDRTDALFSPEALPGGEALWPPESPTTLRWTPALDHFVQSSGAMSAYLRPDARTLPVLLDAARFWHFGLGYGYGTSEEWRIPSLLQVSDEMLRTANNLLDLQEALEDIAYSLDVAPPSGAAHSGAAAPGPATLRVIATRTMPGTPQIPAHADAARARSHALMARFNPDILPAGAALVDLQWGADLGARAAHWPDEVTQHLLNPHALIFLGLALGPEEIRPLYPAFAENLGWQHASMAPTLLALVQHATQTVMTDGTPQDTLSPAPAGHPPARPIALAARLVADSDAQNPLGVRGAIVLTFDAPKDTLDATISQATDIADMAAQASPGAHLITWRTRATPSGGTQLQVGIATDLADAFDAETLTLPPGFTLHTRALPADAQQSAMAGPPLAQSLDIHHAHDGTTSTWTIQQNRPADASPTPDEPPAAQPVAFTPRPAVADCATRLADAGAHLIRALATLTAPLSAAQAQTLLASYDATADACARDYPATALDMTWNKARARRLLAADSQNFLASISYLKSQCPENSPHNRACHHLQKLTAQPTFVADLATHRERASVLLQDACTRGDTLACTERDELPDP